MHVVTFYKFVPIADTQALQTQIQAEAHALDLRGTVLLAEEGINGTICGSKDRLEEFVEALRRISELADLAVKYSRASSDNEVFHRLKIRIKPEIVTMGVPGIDPFERTGQHVDAQRWHELLDDPSVVVIDTRNRYECAIGSFPAAISPDTENFREFPEFVARALDPQQQPKVAMFCTGGIRCEKASAYMLEQGFEAVYQLDGGILQYLEEVAPEDNRWVGDCFVFDQRVSVDPSLNQGPHIQCFACRYPLTEADVAHPSYEVGVSCPHCIDATSETQRRGFAERRRQVELADARGDQHVGKRQERSA